MNLYFRLFWTILRSRWKPAIAVGDTIEMPMRVWPNDVDFNAHMNNGRYLTVIDLALIEYFSRVGLLRVALRKGWRPILGGSLISYRHGLKPFSRYSLRFSMVGWDDRWSYMRFDFVHQGRSTATGYVKGAIVGALGIVGAVERFGVLGIDPVSPVLDAPVLAWIKADRLIRE